MRYLSGLVVEFEYKKNLNEFKKKDNASKMNLRIIIRIRRKRKVGSIDRF